MSEIAEKEAPIVTKSSWFRRFTERFWPKPQLEAKKTPQTILEPEPTLQIQEDSPLVTVPVVSALPVIQEKPRLSKAERRRLKQAEYEKWKARTTAVAYITKRTGTNIPKIETQPVKEIAATPVVEAKLSYLPHGIKERIPFLQELPIDRIEIPWLDKEETEVTLELITLATTKGEQFLYGSLIQGKRLTKALGQMSEEELRSADDILFVQLSELIQTGHSRDIEKVHYGRTKRPIFETGNQNGQRVYFIRFGKLQNIPVIIRIAVGNKAMMRQIFGEISTETNRMTKRSS